MWLGAHTHTHTQRSTSLCENILVVHVYTGSELVVLLAKSEAAAAARGMNVLTI